MIGGNTEALVQQISGSEINRIGERIPKWESIHTLRGWLDLSNGDSKYANDAKLQESTHIFICDYVAIDRNTKDKRLSVNGATYDIMMIDDPMELHQHLEIYLKFVG